MRALIESIGGYPAFFLLCVFSSTLVPLPEDVALLYAGVRISQGEFAWFPTIPIAMVGLLIRDLTSYSIGRVAGEWLLARSWGKRLLGGEAKIERARAFVATHGDKAIFFGRFAVGFRSPVFIIGGAMRLSVRRFIIWDSLGMCIAVPLMIGLGYGFGPQLIDVFTAVLPHARLVVGGLVVVAVAYALWSWRNTEEEPD